MIVAEVGGPPYQTLLRWCSVEPGASDGPGGALVPVDVVMPTANDTIIAIVSPTGWRLVGLELADAVAILRTLG